MKQVTDNPHTHLLAAPARHADGGGDSESGDGEGGGWGIGYCYGDTENGIDPVPENQAAPDGDGVSRYEGEFDENPGPSVRDHLIGALIAASVLIAALALAYFTS